MPTSSSAVSCCMPCRMASTGFATMASSPTANAATISPSVAGCLMPITSRPIPSWRTLTPKAIDRVTPVTSSSVPIAAVPCGVSQPSRAHPHISHSTVIRHDLIAADFRHHRHRACCASCRQSASYADRLPQYRLQSWPSTEPDLLLAFSTQSARSSSPKRRFASIARPSSEQSRQHAVATFPIAPKQSAASFNPASMRSCSRSRPRRRCANDLTEPSRVLANLICDSLAFECFGGGSDAAAGTAGDGRAGSVPLSARPDHRPEASTGGAGAHGGLGGPGTGVWGGLNGGYGPPAAADAIDGGAGHPQAHLRPVRRGAVRTLGREPLLPVLLSLVCFPAPAGVLC